MGNRRKVSKGSPYIQKSDPRREGAVSHQGTPKTLQWGEGSRWKSSREMEIAPQKSGVREKYQDENVPAGILTLLLQLSFSSLAGGRCQMKPRDSRAVSKGNPCQGKTAGSREGVSGAFPRGTLWRAAAKERLLVPGRRG